MEVYYFDIKFYWNGPSFFFKSKVWNDNSVLISKNGVSKVVKFRDLNNDEKNKKAVEI